MKNTINLLPLSPLILLALSFNSCKKESDLKQIDNEKSSMELATLRSCKIPENLQEVADKYPAVQGLHPDLIEFLYRGDLYMAMAKLSEGTDCENNLKLAYEAANKVLKDRNLPTIENPTVPKVSFAAPVISESTDMFTAAGRIIGETTDRNNTEDLQYGTNGDVTGINPDVLNYSDTELYFSMKNLMQLTSMGDLQTACYAFFENFKTNTSNYSTFSNSILDRKVKEHANFETFLQDFANTLQIELNHYNGKIENMPALAIRNRPVFNELGNTFGGLRILINDTEKTEIRLVKYKADKSKGEWIAHIETTIYDHFGLDKNDALTYQSKHLGFAAWWVLQHKKNKVPFITKIVLRHNIKGSYTVKI